MDKSKIEQQARLLARENLDAESSITAVYWFEAESEVRLVELDSSVPVSTDQHLHPFYFRASPKDDLPASSAVALIRPDEFEKLKLPPTWGTWEDAVQLEGKQ